MNKNILTLTVAFFVFFVVSPSCAEETTEELLQVAQLEKIQLPAPIPSFRPGEGYFWGWISETGDWEQIKLGIPPSPQNRYFKDLPALPKGYVWGWDTAQMRWVWLRIKDGNLVIMRMKFKDHLGNLYFKEIAKPSPMPVELQD
ncbi:MAG: hypothetical protein V3S49_04700 [Thermodesulfobacteriota bacterium]